MYKLDRDVTFSCSGYQKDYEELIYDDGNLFPVYRKTVLKYLSPHVSLEDMKSYITKETELDAFWNNFIMRKEGIFIYS